MKAFPWFFLSILLILGPVWSLDTNRAYADKIRQPVRAGQFYPADPAELSRMIDRLTREAQKTRVRIPHDKGLKALIMPHAGFIYSGWTAAHAAQVLTKNQFSKVILLGPWAELRCTGRQKNCSAIRNCLNLCRCP
jgi:hypothetical protein